MRLRRKRKEKCRAFANFALDPDPPIMHFNDPFYQSKTDAGAVRLRVKLVKESKDSFKMLGGNPHAVIAHVKDRLAILLPLLTDLNARFLWFPYELGGII